MKRKSKNVSQSQLDESDEGSLSMSQLDNEHIKAQRKKKPVKKSKQNIQGQDHQILDIHHGDNFVREHFRPGFLKRWDGESNILQLTESELDNMSPMLRVYWQCKSKNMNCIIFAQIGGMEYFAFEDDAIRLHQIFKKKLKKYSCFLMVNFWCKEIELAKVELFERRIPVLVMKQIEDDQYRKQHGIIRREITEVITPSIYLSMEPQKFRQRNMLVFYCEQNKCGVASIDVETNHFYLEQYEGNQSTLNHEIRRLINKFRPVQLLIQKKDIFIKKAAKQICQPYIVEMTPLSGNMMAYIQQMKEVSDDALFQRMSLLYKKQQLKKQTDFSLYPMVKVLGLILNYLKNLTLQAKIFSQGIFEICQLNSTVRPMFDAQVYENLEVFSLKDEEDSFGRVGTLFNFLNKCVTQCGLKLLKKWVDEPLRDIAEISTRQIAIENLIQQKNVLKLQGELMAFQKLERRVGSIYHWALRPKEEGKMILTKDINFQKGYDSNKNPAVTRIKQISQVLKAFLSIQNFLKKVSDFDIDSSLLKKCTHIIEGEDIYRTKKGDLQMLKGLPSIEGLINRILSNIQVDAQTGQIEPTQGINEVFDSEKQQATRINSQLEDKLAFWKKKLGVSKAYFVSIRARNEIEVPLSEVKNKKIPELIFSSQTSKMIRFINPQVANLSEELVSHEIAMALAYEPFASMLVKDFCAHKHIWDMYLDAIAKLDVLMALSKTSLNMKTRCLPMFNQTHVQILNGYHPGLLQVKPNNIVANSLVFKDDERILLLTGPNMGGKSTLLRQTCLLAIMAQIGCFVPAQKYNSIVFDQIFCRIGASDRVVQGKSTFYVELQETKRIVDQATPNSLVIIDELGRGTSTYDGMAIASSVLEYICKEIQSYTLFSTHYFALTSSFQTNSLVKCGKIGYKFDILKEQIGFTYQLQQGIAEKSFANQVARQVGMSQQILQIAKQKAYEIKLRNLQNMQLKAVKSFVETDN